ncbi:YSC84-related protein [Tranquillimonas alkanivorans]|uniref:Lipid-binding SYLF domain-containing protein n=1 Tax=Tranquillimonas alkanivorans TaxID=441119 RepID=A0A1I5NWA2_9RHOB|nr:YSC84-related protein [Tranquillimonas alkanivorans]SFP26065.1 Lipid-binding SYLF domain-containing protein [Tranquillimonas alkanivorans]
MTIQTRRGFLAGAAGLSLLTACNNGLSSRGADQIDARVAATLNYLYSTYPATRDLRDKASGMLVMPVMTEAGFGVGGAYGRGALLVNGVPIDYYAATQASFGLQIGAQQYAHVLFFMTDDALYRFRNSPGWAAGADVKYAVNDRGGNLSAETTTSLAPVIAVVFGQAGLIAGASVEGTKYTRIIP